jgi:signal transduction histidine kinase
MADDRDIGDTGEVDIVGDAEGRPWIDRIGSVRVRLTVAASLVTAVAVALAGVLLVHSVEDTQTSRLRGNIGASVDEVARRLADDADLQQAVEGIDLVMVYDDEDRLLISNPLATVGDNGVQQTIFVGAGVGGSTRSDVDIDDPGGGAGGGTPPPNDPAGEPILTTGDAVDASGQGGGDGAPAPVVRGGSTLDGPDRNIIIFNQTIDDSAAAGIAGSQPGEAVTGFSVIATSAAQVEMVSRRVETSDYGTLRVTAIGPGDEIARTVDAVSHALWLMLPSLVGVVALVAWWLAGRALRPVEAIRLEAESIGGSTIHRRLPEPASDDEIGRLARTMNAMLGRLDRSAQRQRQFVSDASHELRSPVAAIRTDLEVALREGDRADWPSVARAVLAEEGRLERLLNDLLVLAADEETAGASVHGTPVDMLRLAVEEADRPHRVPVRLGATEAAPDPDDATVTGVPARLDRALTNLVDNAVRHARSTVRVTVSREGDFVRTVVDDDGPGIEPADRERIFERFTRLDGSRARRQGGAGLGLAVVRSIAGRHGGYVWADVSPLGGARFTLDLPAHRDGPT